MNNNSGIFIDILRLYVQVYHFDRYDCINCDKEFVYDNSIFTIVFVNDMIYNRLNHETVIPWLLF
jgi:hypothetical protein